MVAVRRHIPTLRHQHTGTRVTSAHCDTANLKAHPTKQATLWQCNFSITNPQLTIVVSPTKPEFIMFKITILSAGAVSETITFASLPQAQAWLQACAQTYESFTMTIVFDINAPRD